MASVCYTINCVPDGLRRMLTGLSEYYFSQYRGFGGGSLPVNFLICNFGKNHKIVADFTQISKDKKRKILDTLETLLKQLEIDFKKQK